MKLKIILVLLSLLLLVSCKVEIVEVGGSKASATPEATPQSEPIEISETPEVTEIPPVQPTPKPVKEAISKVVEDLVKESLEEPTNSFCDATSNVIVGTSKEDSVCMEVLEGKSDIKINPSFTSYTCLGVYKGIPLTFFQKPGQDPLIGFIGINNRGLVSSYNDWGSWVCKEFYFANQDLLDLGQIRTVELAKRCIDAYDGGRNVDNFYHVLEGIYDSSC